MQCSFCNATLDGKDLAELMLRKKLECPYCRNLIVIDEGAQKAMEGLSCKICGGALSAADYTIGQKSFACKYCKGYLDQIDYKEADFPAIFARLKTIPQEMIDEIQRQLDRPENLYLLSKDERKQYEEFQKNFSSRMKDILKSSKWEIAKKSISFIGKGIGMLLGFALVGGLIGSTVGFVVSLIGEKYCKARM